MRLVITTAMFQKTIFPEDSDLEHRLGLDSFWFNLKQLVGRMTDALFWLMLCSGVGVVVVELYVKCICIQMFPVIKSQKITSSDNQEIL